MAAIGDVTVGDVWSVSGGGEVEVTFKYSDAVGVRGGDVVPVRRLRRLVEPAPPALGVADDEGEPWPPPVPTPDWDDLLDRALEVPS